MTAPDDKIQKLVTGETIAGVCTKETLREAVRAVQAGLGTDSVAVGMETLFATAVDAYVGRVLDWSKRKEFWKDCPACKGTGVDVHCEECSPVKCPDCHGTGTEPQNFPQLLMLTVSELSEAMESHRNHDFSEMDAKCTEFTNIEIELADAVIRIMNISGAFKLRLGEAIVAKMAFNDTRPIKHGGKRY